MHIVENNKFIADTHVDNCDHYIVNCDNKSLTSLAGLNISELTEQVLLPLYLLFLVFLLILAGNHVGCS